MTYDQAHKKLWGRVVKLLQAMKRKAEGNKNRRTRIPILGLEQIKKTAWTKSPKLPSYANGKPPPSYCYACMSSASFNATPADQLPPGCPCFLDWGEYQYGTGNYPKKCTSDDTPFARLGSLLKGRTSLNTSDLDLAVGYAKEIRDLPFSHWYTPTEIDKGNL